MGLELIVGPPNSGRAPAVLERLRAAVDRDPVLVVPSGDEAARFERDLAADGGCVGVTIRTFASLVDEIALAAGAPPRQLLSDAQRLALLRSSVAATPLRALARSARSPGFARALDDLIAELEAALVSPAQLRAASEASETASTHERELADLYAAYEELRRRAGRDDAGSAMRAALDALRERPDAWPGRPLFLYGFDDLTEAQLELVRLLSRHAQLVIAVTWEDRRALTARSRLYMELLENPGADAVHRLEPRRTHTEVASLRHLDAELFEPEAGTVERDDGVRLLECAGERGEAEAVGLEIARLLADGARPDEIAIALRRPAGEGPLMASVLRSLGIPVALEAPIPLERTAVGRALLTLCRAAGEEGTPADLIAHLRADPSFPQGAVDWAERALRRREVETLDDVWVRWREPPRHLRRLREAAGPAERLRALAACARELAEAPHRGAAPLVGERPRGTPLDPIELRAGLLAAELLEELAEVGDLPGCEQPDLDDAAEAIAAASVPAWRGSTEGRVRITSPYRLRSGRARFVFCCGLQEGSFPSAGERDPLLGEEARRALGIPALAQRADPADEERYLFHACVSRPTERLYLTWRSCDEEGHPSPRSPFIDEVLDLFADDNDAVEEKLKHTRGLARPVPAPEEAPDPRTLARALALRCGADEGAARRELADLGVAGETADEVARLLAGLPNPGWRPGPLAHPRVLGELGERRLLSAGALEAWIECPYRWFVQHELEPQRLDPPADPLWLGGVVHAALHRLYAEAPGEDSIPRPGDVGRWKRRFGELLAEEMERPGRAAITPARKLAAERAREQVEAFLDAEAQRETDLRPRPELLEASFGIDEEGPGPLELGELALRGRIDRIDVAPDGRRALLHDYKTAVEVPGRKKLVTEGKLQLPLYMLAAQRELGLEPIGAVYHPLGGRRDRRPRGILLADEPLLDGLEHVNTDRCSPEELEETLEAAVEEARTKGGAMREGKIDRAPLNGECPRYCAYQAICRLERTPLGAADEGENGGRG
jgi:RecB family exonuclease